MTGTFKAEPSRPITDKDVDVDELPNFPKSFLEQMLLPFIYVPGQGEPERYRKKEKEEPTPVQEARQMLDAAE